MVYSSVLRTLAAQALSLFPSKFHWPHKRIEGIVRPGGCVRAWWLQLNVWLGQRFWLQFPASTGHLYFSFTSMHQNMSSQTRTPPFPTDGHLFSWGQNSRSQLGHSSDSPSVSTPRVIKALEGVPVTQVATGGRHCFVLSVSGAVYGWGKNE